MAKLSGNHHFLSFFYLHEYPGVLNLFLHAMTRHLGKVYFCNVFFHLLMFLAILSHSITFFRTCIL